MRIDKGLIDVVEETTTLISGSDASETNYTLEDSKPEHKINKWQVIPSLWCGAFLAALDGTIVTAIYPVIGSEFKKSEQAAWIATAYMLASSAFQPLYGGLSDIWGRKTMLIFANSVFLLGSLLCFGAQSLNQLFAARVVAGIGGAGLGTLSSIVVSDLVPLKERSTYNGFANLVYGVGQVIGAPIGGYLADIIGWRYAFLIQCPITAISIVVIQRRVHLHTPKKQASWKDIDFLGSIFLITGVVMILLALEMMKNMGFNSYKPIATFLGSIICFIIVYLIENQVANPIILLPVLTSRNPFLAGMTNFFGYMGFFAITFNLPLFLQVVKGESASKSGSKLISSIVSMCIGSSLAGYITRKTQNYYWVALGGVTCEIIGSLLVSTFRESTEDWKFQAYMFPSGLGHGLVLSATLMAIISAVSKANVAKATSMSYLFRVLGSSFGVTLTSLFNSFMLEKSLTKSLRDSPERQKLIEQIMNSITSVNNLPEGVREQVKRIFAQVVHQSFCLVIIIELISLGFASFLKQYSLDR